MSNTTPQTKRSLNVVTYLVLSYALGSLIVGSVVGVLVAVLFLNEIRPIMGMVLLSLVIATPVGWKFLGAMGYEKVSPVKVED